MSQLPSRLLQSKELINAKKARPEVLPSLLLPKVGVVVPTRDRPAFLFFALERLRSQTRVPDEIIVVDDPPLNAKKDLTRRFRLGCERAFALGCDVVLFVEDDDFYARDYVEQMLAAWDAKHRPEIFGIGETIYYHIGSRAWMHIAHPTRASAMSTMVTKRVLDLKWPPDDTVFLDMFLWKVMKGRTFTPTKPICIGIKHGIGTVGGAAHDPKWRGYVNKDPEMTWLLSVTDVEAVEFYKKITCA